MLFRAHNTKTNELLHDGFLIDTRGRLVSETAEGLLSDCTLQVGTIVDSQEVYVGDAIIIDLEENNYTQYDMNNLLSQLGLLVTPDTYDKTVLYDTLVLELDTRSNTEVCNILFKHKGNYIKNTYADAGDLPYFTAQLSGLQSMFRLVSALLFKVGYNCTSQEWKSTEIRSKAV